MDLNKNRGSIVFLVCTEFIICCNCERNIYATDFECNGLYNSIVTIIVESQDVYKVYSTSQHAQTHIIPVKWESKCIS